MKKLEIIANKNDRVLKILEKSFPNITYSAFSTALRKKDIILNGDRIKDNLMVQVGSSIIVYVPDTAEKKDLFEIVYEDKNIIFINKKQGIETCDGNYNVLDELNKKGIKAFSVHRLDRNTLGLVVFAKNIEVQKTLINAFKNKLVEKYYYAEVVAQNLPQHKILNGFLVKNKDESQVMIYNKKEQNSVPITTEFDVVKTSGGVSLLSVKIKDGKTHQIRAHLAYNKIYIVGDGKYGKNEINAKYKSKTQHLKAYKIKFSLPKDSSLYYLNDLKLQLDERF